MADPSSRLENIRSLIPWAHHLLKENFNWKLTGRWMMYSVLVGIIGAVGALIFSFLVDNLNSLTLVQLAGFRMPAPGAPQSAPFDLATVLRPSHRWWLLVLPAAGGLVAGALVFWVAPEASGLGEDAVIEAYHQRGGRIRGRVPFVKMIASTLVIGTGGSAGQEGPMAQISAGFGSMLGRRLKLEPYERRILMLAGVAAGIGSIFQAPLGAAFLSVEVLYREDLETEAIMPSVIAAITGYSIYSSVVGSRTVFVHPDLQFVSPLELLPLVVFAVMCAVLGIAFMTMFSATRGMFDRLNIPVYLKPAVGGLLVGIMAFFFPAVLGTGYGWLQQAIEGHLPLLVMVLIVVMKIAATIMTVGSGGSGGIFAPSLVIGGMLGGVYGTLVDGLFPVLVGQPAAFVEIGMATFFTGVANMPISMTIMISEMTGGYSLLVPLIFSGVLVHLIARNWSIYDHQLRYHDDSPAHRATVAPEMLSEVQVGAVIDPVDDFHTLNPSHRLNEIIDVFTRTREVVLPVRKSPSDDSSGSAYSGLVLLEDIQSILDSDEALSHLIIAEDLAVPFASISSSDMLTEALEVFQETGYPELPVIDDGGEIVGFLDQERLFNEYHRAYLRLEGPKRHTL